jgi:D-3-phosphoglycerate dehydrogenase / 2-oxoglutarate reductase
VYIYTGFKKLKKALITDDCHPILIEGLTARGYSCDYQPDITLEKTRQIIGAYEGLIVNSKILVDRSFLEAAQKLKFIGRLGSGMEIIDRASAAEKGVAVFSSPEGNKNAVAEQALGMLLALANNMVRADREVRQNNWRREANRGFELAGRTIGIIGFGHTGSQFAKKLQGMEMRVLAWDKYLRDYTAGYDWVTESSLATIQEKADIISLHLPLTAETKHYVNAGFIEKCKPGIIFLNTSRGHCIHTGDLVAALESGRVGGACLDVFENEKPQTYTDNDLSLYKRLHQLDTVILTPHIAGWTFESKKRLANILLEKIFSAMS